jgi:hypothetical protein
MSSSVILDVLGCSKYSGGDATTTRYDFRDLKAATEN